MVPISWMKAESLMGQRVDRRRNYFTTDDGRPVDLYGDGRLETVFVLESCVVSCSGCTELIDGQNMNGYHVDEKHGCFIGGGCHECWYTGKIIERFWFPYIGCIEGWRE